MSSAVQVQTTKQVFFPLHLVSRCVWWQLAYLGFLPHRPNELFHVPGLARAQAQQSGYRCRICGFLQKRALAIVHHHRACHNRPVAMACYGEAAYEPQHVRRDFAFLAEGDAGQESQLKYGPSIDALAVAQAVATPPSLSQAIHLIQFFSELLGHVQFANEPYGLTKHNWCRAVVAFTSGPIFRLCPRWWASYPLAVMTGQYQGRSVEEFVPPVPSPHALASRQRDAASRASTSLLSTVVSAQSFVRELHVRFRGEVIDTHGDHVPNDILDDATVALRTTPKQIRHHAFGVRAFPFKCYLLGVK